MVKVWVTIGLKAKPQGLEPSSRKVLCKTLQPVHSRTVTSAFIGITYYLLLGQTNKVIIPGTRVSKTLSVQDIVLPENRQVLHVGKAYYFLMRQTVKVVTVGTQVSDKLSIVSVALPQNR